MDVEATCYESVLHQAELANAYDDDDAKESFDNCIHSQACRRAFYLGYYGNYDTVWENLSCDVCGEYRE